MKRLSLGRRVRKQIVDVLFESYCKRSHNGFFKWKNYRLYFTDMTVRVEIYVYFRGEMRWMHYTSCYYGQVYIDNEVIRIGTLFLLRK